MSDLRADSSVQFVKGIGPRRAQALAELDIHTVDDLLHHFPFRYEQDCGEVPIEHITPGAVVTIRGEVIRTGGRRPSFRCDISDGTGTCELRWFNQRFRAPTVPRGAFVIATGKAEVYNDHLSIVQPRIDVFEPDAELPPPKRGGQLIGIYPCSARIQSRVIRDAVMNVLRNHEWPTTDVLPEPLRQKRDLPTHAEAVQRMHCPRNEEDARQARARLAYEELLVLELAMAMRRQRNLLREQGQRLYVTPEIDRRIRARFPFELTAGQDTVIRQIATDIESGHPMTRLLQGDVGCGKTVVALYACLVAVACGKQAAIMAPTEVLATQHYANIEQYLQDSRVRTALLRGGLGTGERRDLRERIARGEVDLVVGTQALIQDDVSFDQLAVVVVDEQHKFGVVQRHQFRTKGPMPHYLVMTATPIPRTLAMTVFGDLEVSVIRESPPGRGRIDTHIVPARDWDAAMRRLRSRIESGDQAYVVCPRIGDTGEAGDTDQSTSTTSSVQEMHRRLVAGPWKGVDVGLLHGSLPRDEKDAVIADFKKGRLQAVVSTTVVEVGVDVPSATIMVIENADRFGLAQLHQLRGRVGRGQRDSLCVLIARGRGEKAIERLNVLAETTDGFRIAEADLRQRGPGQLLGTRQHGLPELQIASLVDDFALLEQAREDAFAIIQADPTLRNRAHQPLRAALLKMFGGTLALIDAA